MLIFLFSYYLILSFYTLLINLLKNHRANRTHKMIRIRNSRARNSVIYLPGSRYSTTGVLNTDKKYELMRAKNQRKYRSIRTKAANKTIPDMIRNGFFI